MRLEDIKEGDVVAYIPEHFLELPTYEQIKNHNIGIVSSKNADYVFVKYWGGDNSQATRPDDLYTLRNRPEKVELLAKQMGVENIIGFLYEKCDKGVMRIYTSD